MTRSALALVLVAGLSCDSESVPPPAPSTPSIKLPRTGNRWRDAALAVGEDVLARAHADAAGVYWSIVVETSPGQRQTEALPDVYSGNAGVLLFLAELSRESGARELDDWLQRGTRWLDAAAAPDLGDGLYVGRTGVGWLDLSLFEALGDRVWLDRAIAIGGALEVHDSDLLDVIYGSAGEGLFYLRLHAATQDARWLRAAERRADWLLAHAVTDAGGLKWASAITGPYATVYYPGISHGTAGVGLFLARLAATPDAAQPARYLDAARRAASWLRAVAQERGGHIAWYFSSDDKTSFPVQWCHGSAGIGLFFLELYRSGGDPADLALARRCAEATWAWGPAFSPVLCHGAAGNAVLFLALQRETGEAVWLDRAGAFADEIWRVADVAAGAPRWEAVDGSGAENLSFMVGSPGIGSFFLRLAAAADGETREWLP